MKERTREVKVGKMKTRIKNIKRKKEKLRKMTDDVCK